MAYKPSKKDVFLLATISLIITYFLFNTTDFIIVQTGADHVYHEKYLINTSTCQIPDVNPFNEEVKRFYHPEEYIPCTDKGLLSFVSREGTKSHLNINQSLLPAYSYFETTCCYSNISRTDDNNIIIGQNCRFFRKKIEVTHPLILVKCRTIFTEVYSNVHYVFLVDNKTETQSNHGNFSVILLGIDSISKPNLVRTMPKTLNLLDAYNFINLKGYTKIADNTLPNLMAILSGKTRTQYHSDCEPYKKPLDDCYFLWNSFKDSGYVTAYGEDETAIGTFNQYIKGFEKPPTDFYFRPYLIAAERLGVWKRNWMSYCSGPENTGERVLNLAKDFMVTFEKQKKFGLFWMNSFSHEALNAASSMDEKLEEFFLDIYEYLDDTILVFFSDHGFRFGSIRYTYTGYVEERLPFIHIYLPDRYKADYPEQYNNFLVNSQRLTVPFDLFLTFQDILGYKDVKSEACPKCRSLFQEVDEARTCEDAAIADHWCVCQGHTYVDPNDREVVNAAQVLTKKLNDLIESLDNENQCSHFYLNKVVSAGRSDKNGDFLIIIETFPKAIFEATIDSSFQISGEVSRVDRYAKNSYCVKHSILRKYCYCRSTFNLFYNFLLLK